MTTTTDEEGGSSEEDGSSEENIPTTRSRAEQQSALQSVSEPADADLPADTSTSGRVVVGETATGTIAVVGDRDWFAVTLEARTVYRIDLEGVATSQGTLSAPWLAGVHDAQGILLDDTSDYYFTESPNSRIFFTPQTSGKYHVAAGGDIGDRNVGTYRLAVSEFPDDYAADRTTTGTVSVAGSTTGRVDFPNDRDWFAVTLTAGTVYRIDLEGVATSQGTLPQPLLDGVHDAQGIRQGGTGGHYGAVSDGQVFFTPQTSGKYYVAAGGVVGYRNVGTYRLAVSEFPEDYVADRTTTGTVSVAGSTTGKVDFPGDRDWFAVTLKAGTPYWIGTTAQRGYPVRYGVHDADGNLIANTADDNSGRDWGIWVLFTPQTDGPYYIVTGGSYNSDYRLTVMDATDDYAANTGTTGTVTLGSVKRGEIDQPGDRDWFAVTLRAQRTYQIDLQTDLRVPVNRVTNTRPDPYLYGLYDTNGDRIANTEDDARVIFTPETAGKYYIEVGEVGTGIGAYRLTVVQQDLPADIHTPATIAVGGSTTDSTDGPTDVDWFKVTLVADTYYQIDLKRTVGGTLRDPSLRGVYDMNGTLIANTADDDSGEWSNSVVFFKPSADGIYYIAAGSARGGGYRLSVRAVPADDYTADINTTATVSVGGSATGQLEVPDDRDWFRVTLTAGTTYQIDQVHQDGYRRWKLWGIYDATGNLIPNTQDNNAHFKSRVFFTPSTTGPHYIAAGATGKFVDHTPITTNILTDYNAAFHVGGYRLSVNIITDDYTADATTTATVSVGGAPVIGRIEVPGDVDWWAVELTAGTSYRIDQKKREYSLNPYLRGIHDSSGILIPNTTNDNGGEPDNIFLRSYNSIVYFTPSNTDTYYIAAGANGSNPYKIGSYSLSVKVQ